MVLKIYEKVVAIHVQKPFPTTCKGSIEKPQLSFALKSRGESIMKQLLTLFALCNIHIGYSQSIESILLKTEEKINSLKCLSYKSVHSSSMPRDTLLYYRHTRYFDVVSNPNDSIIGSSFKVSKDSTKIEIDYHDNLEISYNWDKKTVRIGTINPSSYFIGLDAPLVYRLKALIGYVLTNRDSVECSFQGFKDSTQLNFVFRHRFAPFVNLNAPVESNDSWISTFTVWLTKDYLPYRWTQRVSDQTVLQDLTYFSINDCDTVSHRTGGLYLPEGFVVGDRKGQPIKQKELVGEQVGSWVLEKVEGDSVRFSDFKGKALLVEFTGLGCGPCEQAFPFLKKLIDEYNNKDFQFVSIEMWEKDKARLRRYIQLNAINFEYLISPSETYAGYQIWGVPQFAIVDKSGIIRKAFAGFEKGTTDKEIRAAINSIL